MTKFAHQSAAPTLSEESSRTLELVSEFGHTTGIIQDFDDLAPTESG